MKEEYVKKFIKVKHAEGVLYRGSFFKYEGTSRVDGLPLFSYECIPGVDVPLGYYFNGFVFNGKPHYIPTMSDFEPVGKQNPFMDDDIFSNTFEVKPLSPPSGILYAMDIVYDEYDPRLLLALSCG